MARVGGRSSFLAWFAGIVCAGVIVGLLWLAIPVMPDAVQFVGDMLRSTYGGG
ncbi:hypothetical protein [Microbacterium sp. YY-01]|uniref:hypothetical protein n=1 Tax=Microbacterium sp. YY-01 TaxID=3421634 RepID=UPI003D184718